MNQIRGEWTNASSTSTDKGRFVHDQINSCSKWTFNLYVSLSRAILNDL